MPWTSVAIKSCMKKWQQPPRLWSSAASRCNNQYNNKVENYFSGNSWRQFSSWHRLQSRKLNYMQTLKWTSIPLGVGFGLIAYQHYYHVRTRKQEKISEQGKEFIKQWELSFYRSIPLRATSRAWGWLNDLELPRWARRPVLSLYSKSFGCNLEEAEIEEFERYRNLGEFFRRGLKPLARTIHPGDSVVSPADGIVMSCGLVSKCSIEQVKGVSYSLNSFLGDNTWSTIPVESKLTPTVYQKILLTNPEENELFHYVVYLAPGDYHRFHSPVDWKIRFRRHFTGDLLSVRPGIAKWIPGLFTLNERVAYIGKWKHGFFSLTAVGATNVGSIKVYKDEELETNCRHLRKGMQLDHHFAGKQSINITKGEPFGEFNLGSTVVLIFEAPRHYRFSLKAGDRIKMGELLTLEQSKTNTSS